MPPYLIGFCQMGNLGRTTSCPQIDPAIIYIYLSIFSEMQVLSNSWGSYNHSQAYKDTHEVFFHLSNTRSPTDPANTLEVSVRTIKMALGLE